MLHRFKSGPSSSPVWLENLACSHDYTRGTYNCTHNGLGVTDCSHSKDVAVSCLAGINNNINYIVINSVHVVLLTLMLYSLCTDGAVRLVSSSYYSQSTSSGGSAGRLEVYHNRQWGSVCNSGFSQTDANVVCRQLGYPRAYRYGSVNNLG